MDREVALWQRGVEHDGDKSDSEPAGHLFEASTTTFSAILELIASEADIFDLEIYQRLRNEFRRFYIWNVGFSTQSGELDCILTSSKNLKATVLGLLAKWATAVVKAPLILPEYDWSPIIPALAELKVIAHKVDQVAKATMIDMQSQYFVLKDAKVNYESDSDSESMSSISDATFEDLIEDLSTYMENLLDLSQSLEHPAVDILIYDTGTARIDDLSSVPEAARPFVIILKDRFPSMEPALGRKLGEANWLRRERLGQKLTSTAQRNVHPASFADNQSEEDTLIITNDHLKRPSAPSIDPATRAPSYSQSITVDSTFSGSSLFDSYPIATPHQRRNPQVARSVTSFVTSLADGSGYGQRRIPQLPDHHNFELPFQCQLCGVNQEGIQNRVDWKNHVYHDLEPYVCLFTDCSLGIQTFASRREWIKHEFQVHRVTEQWCCNLCDDTFMSRDLFQNHIYLVHEERFDASQNGDFISAAKKVVSRDSGSEVCPFCLISLATTQKGFSSHVGRHQLEISLAALPNLEMESDKGDSDDDSDVNGDGSGANSSDEDTGTRTLQLHFPDDNPNRPSASSTSSIGAIKFQTINKNKDKTQQDKEIKEQLKTSLPSAFTADGPQMDTELLDSRDSKINCICKGCGEILEEGEVFELDETRWHPNCFRCEHCTILLKSDSMILIGDGRLICDQCASCSKCHKIENNAILTNGQAFCTACFTCRNCKQEIKTLRYARTLQGILCMACHDSLMSL